MKMKACREDLFVCLFFFDQWIILKFQELDATTNAERIELANQQMLLNILPPHIAQNFPSKSDLYHHICHSAGIAHITVWLIH